MGWYVHIHVAFSCDENEPVAKIAAKHRPLIEDINDGARAARWFLDDLSGRTGRNPGPKGGLCLWGITGNYTKGDDFVEALRPFFKDLFENGDGNPFQFERIMVFTEQEQSDAAEAWQIGYDEEARELVVKHFPQLPFSWGQS